MIGKRLHQPKACPGLVMVGSSVLQYSTAVIAILITVVIATVVVVTVVTSNAVPLKEISIVIVIVVALVIVIVITLILDDVLSVKRRCPSFPKRGGI